VPNVFKPTKPPKDARYAIVVAKYNEDITSKLLDGAVETLLAADVPDDAIDVIWVPGAWEIPLTASWVTWSDKYAAVICLGVVIRGETTHDQQINQQVNRELGRLAVESNVPILFGVLTCNTRDQAVQRAGGSVGNKGSECAQAALEMASLYDLGICHESIDDEIADTDCISF